MPKTREEPLLPLSPHQVDRKLDFLVKELKEFVVRITGIQETNRFGNDIRNALLHSGRPLPGDDKQHVRNEGVGILLDSH